MANVDQLIGTLVWAMEWTQARIRAGYFEVWADAEFPPVHEEIETHIRNDGSYQRAQAVLDSATVTQWRTRQEEKK